MKDVILYFTLKYSGDWEKVYSAIEQKEQIPIKELAKIKDQLKYNYISIIDSNYPDNLKEIYKPPFSLFWKGDDNLFNKKIISIFGELKNEDIEKLRLKYDDGVFAIQYSKKNKDLIKYFVDHNIKFIAIAQGDIDSVFGKEKADKLAVNNLLVSEYQCKPENAFVEQSWIRVSIGLSLKPVIKYEYSNMDSNVAVEIAMNDAIKLYSYDVEDKSIISKFGFTDSMKKNIFSN